ncbi:MAG: 50S ribosomal protein L35 [Clostridia bacterium]|nr:50S ribosomal protein L35 [Clostridia bacterium]MBC7347891.1 50S ribosomal protein L35 [Clostridia bacterium]
MPKMKTHRGAAKRFRYTGLKRVRRAKAFKSHLLAKKSSRRKRRLGQSALVSPADRARLKRLLPYD